MPLFVSKPNIVREIVRDKYALPGVAKTHVTTESSKPWNHREKALPISHIGCVTGLCHNLPANQVHLTSDVTLHYDRLN